MAKKTFCILLFLLILKKALNAQIIPTFTEKNNPPIKVPIGQDFTFGYLTVPENRSDPNSSTIDLPVYIFKSRSNQPKPDPVIYTVGGPGSSSMNAAGYMKYYKYLDDRDFILFEQRGTYYSKPSLDCPEWEKRKKGYNSVDAARDCKERLVQEGIDLNGYRTTEIAADMEDLRKLLGIKQWNLLTISYSTKIAQVIIREYPETIRSVVMDSPLPLEVSYDEESSKNLMEVLNRVFDDCENQLKCNTSFPKLKDRFFTFLTERNESPLRVGDDKTITYSGTEIALILAGLSYDTSPKIPALAERLLSGDYSNLPSKNNNSGPFSDGIGVGMRLSVWCAEEFPFVSQENIENERIRYPEIKGYNPEVFSKEVCNNWLVEPEGSEENKAVKSEIPTLIINGSYDASTPLSWAEQIHENLSNSFLLVFSGWKHTPTTNWGNPCAMHAANEFFNNPEKIPTSECIEEAKNIQFITN